MGDTTRISWSSRTVNFWIGCRHVDECCDRCYAEVIINRFRGPKAFDKIVRTKTWNDPKRWQREAKAAGRFDLVFTCSMSDFFIQEADEWRPEAWNIIRDTPNLIYQILTKRPDLIDRRLPPDWGADGYPNVWLGVSIGMKKNLKRMGALRKIPARIRFISAEPLIEDICPEIEQYTDGYSQFLVGGESGNGTTDFRVMDPQWARNILAVCRSKNIAFFYKQSSAVRTEMGTALDGIEYHEYPDIPELRTSRPANAT